MEKVKIARHHHTAERNTLWSDRNPEASGVLPPFLRVHQRFNRKREYALQMLSGEVFAEINGSVCELCRNK